VLSEFGSKLGVSVLEKLGGSDGGIVDGERVDLHLIDFRNNGEIFDATIFGDTNSIPILVTGNLSVTYFRFKFGNQYIVDCEIVPSNNVNGSPDWKMTCVDITTYQTIWVQTTNESVYAILEFPEPINLSFYVG
jgi:hypothetical protein